MSEQPLVSPEEMASVLSGNEEAAAAAQTGDDPGDGAYSLRRPVAIAPDEEPYARKRMGALARGIEQSLSKDLETEIQLEVQGFQQQQVSVAVSSVADPVWVLSFVEASAGGVSLLLDATAALMLVELALGGHGNTPAAGRAPTPLESRVMTNLATTLRAPLNASCRTQFTLGRFGIDGVPRELAAPGEIVGSALLKLKLGGQERGGLLLVTAPLIKPAPEAAAASAGEPGPMAARLGRVVVEVRPVLRAGLVSLSDLMHVEQGSVLKLDAPDNALLALRVAGQTLMRGHIARDGGASSFEVRWRKGTQQAPEPTQAKTKEKT